MKALVLSPVINKKRSNFVPLSMSCALMIISLLTVDLCHISLPSLIKTMNVSDGFLEIIIGLYFLSLALSQIVCGPLSDVFGRKPMAILSLILLGIGSGLATQAISPLHVVGSRIVTGFGAGGCTVLSKTILGDVYSTDNRLTRGFSILAMGAQVSPLLAPVFGGIIQEHYGWQGNFYTLGFIGIAFVGVLSCKFNETLQNQETSNIIQVISRYADLSQNRHFIGYTIISAVVYTYTISYYTMNPFIFQRGYGLSPLLNSFIYILYPIGLLMGALITKMVHNHLCPQAFLKFSLGALVGLPFFFSIIAQQGVNFIVAYTTLTAFFCGISVPLLMSSGMAPFRLQLGVTCALQGTLKMLGTGILLFSLLSFFPPTELGLLESYKTISLILLPCFLHLLSLPQPSSNKKET